MTTSFVENKSHLPDEAKDRRRGGRPSLPAGEQRVRRVTVPFSELELQRVFEMARAVSLPAATLIRAAVLRVQLRRPVVPEEFRTAWTALSHTVANINQLTHRVNLNLGLGEVSDGPILAELHNNVLPKVLFEIQELRRVLLTVSDDQ